MCSYSSSILPRRDTFQRQTPWYIIIEREFASWTSNSLKRNLRVLRNKVILAKHLMIGCYYKKRACKAPRKNFLQPKIKLLISINFLPLTTNLITKKIFWNITPSHLKFATNNNQCVNSYASFGGLVNLPK